MTGTLYLCATPIGNLGDISKRCAEAFENADLIAAEDTRQTVKLLNHLGLSKPLTSYHEHNKREKGKYIISLLKQGKSVVQVSDAGTPAISDPGEELVRLCIENNITVTSIPGPVAAINALILSGLSTKRFSFEGFLSVNKRSRNEHLKALENEERTMIFYEAPHKLKTTLADMREIFGGERKIALCRELTKIHEEIIRADIDTAIKIYEEKSPKGEYVLIIDGAKEKPEDKTASWWEGLEVDEHVAKYIEKGMNRKDAIKQTAQDRNAPRRDIYNEFHRKEKK